MAKVFHFEDGDASVIRWGENGREHVVRPGDDPALWDAWRKAVAEGLSRGDLVEDEVDRSVAREVQEAAGIRVAKDGNGGGIMIAWYPSEEEAQALLALAGDVEGAVPAEELHLTLMYLDDSEFETGYEHGQWDLQLVAAVCKLFSRRWGPMEARIGGTARFVGIEDEDAVVLLVDCPYLANLRRCLEDDLYCQGAIPMGAKYHEQHHGFIPHITLAYVPKGSDSGIPPLTEPLEFEVDNIALAAGDTSMLFPLMEWGYAEDDAEPAKLVSYGKAKDATVLSKAGRVLSAANLAAVEAALDALSVVAERERSRGREPEEETDETEKARRTAILKDVGGESGAEALEYVVTKASKKKRYTMGPLYAPERKDAHGEYVEPDTLQEAVWDYVKQSAGDGRRMMLQHGDLGEIQVAEWVEVMAWPYEHEITVKAVGGEERTLTMPAGTVYLGAIWDEDTWPLVEKGKLNGWSLGGRAVKVAGRPLAELEHMGDAVPGTGA